MKNTMSSARNNHLVSGQQDSTVGQSAFFAHSQCKFHNVMMGSLVYLNCGLWGVLAYTSEDIPPWKERLPFRVETQIFTLNYRVSSS